jgi:hypothetical protein
VSIFIKLIFFEKFDKKSPFFEFFSINTINHFILQKKFNLVFKRQKILLEGGSGSGFVSKKGTKKSKKATNHDNCSLK